MLATTTPTKAASAEPNPPPLRVAVKLFARLLPVMVLLAAGAILSIGGCGRSIYPFATASSAATSTATPTPGPGHYAYLTNHADGKVTVFSRNLNTGLLTPIGLVAAGAKAGPIGLVENPAGNYLYLANAADDTIYEFKIGIGGALAKIGAIAETKGSEPQNIALDATASNAYVTNFSGSISEYTIKSGSGLLTANGSVSGLTAPFGITSANGFVYVSDNTAGTINSFSIGSNGQLTFIASVPSLGIGTGTPGPLIVDPSGNFLYVTDMGTGVVSLFSGAATGTLIFVNIYTTGLSTNHPVGLTIATTPASSLFLYTANQNTSSPSSVSVFSVNPSLGYLILLSAGATGTDTSPTGVAADTSGTFLYVTNQKTGTVTIFEINPTTGSLGAPIATVNSEKPANPASAPQFIVIAQ